MFDRMSRERFYSDDDVRRAVAESSTLTEALRRLGLRAAGGNYKTLKALIVRLGIATDHLDPGLSRRRALALHCRKRPLEEVLTEHSTYNRSNLKQRLYAGGIKQRRCEMCGQDEEWRGGHMSLILDHVNGIHDDNRLENLRIICPNCNATLDTHCGRKNRSGPRDCLYCGQEFHPGNSRQQYCSKRCGVRNPGPRDPHPEHRKVERPPYDELIAEVKATNYSAVARKYGVSDNAVRKWVRAYEWQRSQEERADAA
jgi:hypothetical protein